MAKFKIGDTVMLKSGGPRMTVTKIMMSIALRSTAVSQPTGIVKVSWFSDNKDHYS